MASSSMGQMEEKATLGDPWVGGRPYSLLCKENKIDANYSILFQILEGKMQTNPSQPSESSNSLAWTVLWTLAAADYITHSNRSFIRWKMQRKLLHGFKDFLSQKEYSLLQKGPKLPFFLRHSDWYKSYVLPKELHLSLPLDPSRPLILDGPGYCGKTSRILKYAQQVNKYKGTPVVFIPLEADIISHSSLSVGSHNAYMTLLECIGYPTRPSFVAWLFSTLKSVGMRRTPSSENESMIKYVEHAVKEHSSVCYKLQQRLMRQHGLPLTEATPLIIIDAIESTTIGAFRPKKGANLFPSVASIICRSAVAQKSANIVMTAIIATDLKDLEKRLSPAVLRRLDFSEWSRSDFESQLQKKGYSPAEINRLFEVYGCNAWELLNFLKKPRMSPDEIEAAIAQVEKMYMQDFTHVFCRLQFRHSEKRQQVADILDSLASGKSSFVMRDQMPPCIVERNVYGLCSVSNLLYQHFDSSFQFKSQCAKYVWLKNKQIIMKNSSSAENA